jgi:arylsulfatase A-like enzyme
MKPTDFRGDPPSRPAFGRGLLAGLAYGPAYLACEVLAAAAMLEWLGASARIFTVIRGELLAMLVGYAVLGAALGVALAPLVWLTERALPVRWRGPGVNYMLLAWSFIGIALLWNPQSILPRRAYVLGAFGALGVILAAILAGRAAQATGRRVPRARRRPLLAGVTVAAVVVAVRLLVGGGEVPRTAAPAGGTPRPNVVLIVADTLRRDHVSAYGYRRRTSPSIDRLAEEGALYERAYSTAGWTLPAHASLFTGLYTSTHQTDARSIRLGEGLRTLAEILRDHGYRTAGFSANPWLNPTSGLEQGFERLDYVGVRTVTGALFLTLAIDRWRAVRGQTPPDLGGAAVTERLIGWMDQAAPGPFFAFANYMEVHEPYGSVPEPFFSTFLDAPLPRDAGQEWVRDAPLFLCRGCEPSRPESAGVRCEGGRWRVSHQRRQQAEALYDAGVLYVDAQVGRIRAALDRHGLLDRTLVIVTSDHGETLGERGQMGHGLLYESVLEIPLVIRYPRLFPPRTTVPVTASLVDILPTVEEIVGLPRSATDGVSLVPGHLPAERPVLAEQAALPERTWRAVGRRLGCDYTLAGRDSASLRSGPHKLIWSSRGDHELYDPVHDPREETNLARERPEEVRRLAEALQGWRAALRKRSTGGHTYEVDPATRKALESLGYVN